MKSVILSWLAWLAAMASPTVQAIEPGEVRDFADVFVISAEAPSRELVKVRHDK